MKLFLVRRMKDTNQTFGEWDAPNRPPGAWEVIPRQEWVNRNNIPLSTHNTRMQSLSDSPSSLVSIYNGTKFWEGGCCFLERAISFPRGPLTKGDSISGRSDELLDSLSVNSITSFPRTESNSWCLFPRSVDPNVLQSLMEIHEEYYILINSHLGRQNMQTIRA